jgi:hypothetical protein
MNAFQLDQNLNSKKFASECNAQGKAKVLRYPRRLMDENDDIMLPDLLSKEAPLVTSDFTIVEDNQDCIPYENSGDRPSNEMSTTSDHSKKGGSESRKI